jgi:cytochrome c5
MSAGRRLAALVLAATTPFGAQAGDAERGKSLHDQQCTRCHDAAMYTRPQSRIRDFAALRERVQQCELAAELMWFEEDVDDVAAYLNEAFYEFK